MFSEREEEYPTYGRDDDKYGDREKGTSGTPLRREGTTPPSSISSEIVRM